MKIELFLLGILPISFKPRLDAQRYGPLGAALLHLFWHISLRGKKYGVLKASASSPAWHKSPYMPSFASPAMPNIFLVQAESFCDPRLYSVAMPQELLRHYDNASSNGMSTRLKVTAYGAYTMRTEYSVLSGIGADSLGTDAFHPYLSAARYPTWSIARFLHSLGYHTVCIHPYYSHFFLRHKAIPNLGFDKFITLENFSWQDKFGPYVSDKSVAKAMLDLLQEQRPLFCFAITMENHGPWLESRFPADNLYEQCHESLDLQIRQYLTHLRHADEMIGMLCHGVRQARRNGILGWYGDHLPNLPQIIPPDAMATPCLIWNTSESLRYEPAQSDAIEPEDLCGLLLDCAGLANYVHK